MYINIQPSRVWQSVLYLSASYENRKQQQKAGIPRWAPRTIHHWFWFPLYPGLLEGHIPCHRWWSKTVLSDLDHFPLGWSLSACQPEETPDGAGDQSGPCIPWHPQSCSSLSDSHVLDLIIKEQGTLSQAPLSGALTVLNLSHSRNVIYSSAPQN